MSVGPNTTGVPSEAERGSQEFERRALAADARELVEFVETTHPEPFVGYDGRVDLHAALERTVRELPETATAEEFYRRAAPLIAGLADSHSRLHGPERDDDGSLPLSVRVVGEGLYVDAVHDEDHAGLLGGRLLVVEDEPIEELVARVSDLYGAENDYYARMRAGSLVAENRSLDRLLGRQSRPEQVRLRFRRDSEEGAATLDPVGAECEAETELPTTFPHPEGTGSRYRLYEGGDAAVFVPGDLQGYRESFEAALDRGAAVAEELAPAAYERHVGDDPPEDTAAVVAALPSMAESLTRLTEEMASASTETLVVDVRDNPGGDSTFLLFLAYLLDGFAGIERLSEGTKAVKRRTEPHRERYGEGDAQPENPASYDFEGYFDDERSVEQHREVLTRSSTFEQVLEAGDYEGLYEPEQLIVVTSAGTMSSGFAVAAQLTALGADVVGIPSGQAPRSFGEPVERQLTNTGLTAHVACSLYDWVPVPDGRVLEMDAELTPERFEQYERAADAGLRLAFDHAGHTDGEPPEPVDP